MLCSSSLRIASIAVLACGLLPSDAQAGPLIDWLFGRNRMPPAYAVGAPAPVGSANPYAMGYGAYSPYGSNPYAAGYGTYSPATLPGQFSATQGLGGQGLGGQPAAAGYAANYGAYYGPGMPVIGPAGAGYQVQMPSGIAAATMPGLSQATVPQTLSYVPNFNTYSNRAAVTYYRPLLTTDPNTGAQVVAMAPCTSYEYQAQRVPAFGRSALFGSTAPPVMQPAPAGLPTYTLPSGGIPLAGVGPSVMQPTVSGYGVYPTPQAGMSYSAPGAFPTAPLGQSSYYGTNSGGSCGAYQGGLPVPGLVAPQAPVQNFPAPSFGSPAPGYPAPTPGYLPPSNPGVYPPANAPSADPAANVPPVLPPSFQTNSNSQSYLRPRTDGILRQPTQQNSQQVGGSSANSATQSLEAPALLNPIPVPQGFEERPRWNPGLLQEGDMTAERPNSDSRMVVAGQSKTIHWASFEGESRTSLKRDARDTSSDLTLAPSYGDGGVVAGRDIAAQGAQYHEFAREPSQSGLSGASATNQPLPQLRRMQPAPAQAPSAPAPNRRYDNSGWEVAR